MRVAIIVLAAGASRRFGPDNKLLALVDGEALVARVTRELQGVRIGKADVEVIVVVADARGDTARVLEALPENFRPRVVVNARAERGLGTSIAAGIAALGPDIDAAMIVPGDMPRLTARHAERLIQAFLDAGRTRVAHPVLEDGRKVGPAVWPRARFGELMALGGDSGGRELFEREPTAEVPFDAEAASGLADIDTQADLMLFVQGRAS